MKYTKQKIVIDDQEYWYLPAEQTSPSGPIAPLSHCDENGDLNIFNCFSSDAFAHVFFDGTIMRYGKIIGNISDFIKN